MPTPPAPEPRLRRLYIENCERYSEWLMLEYRHCIQSWPGAVFTNVGDRRLFEALSPLAETRRSSLSRLASFAPRSTIVLDPAASAPLTTGDLDRAGALVVGGILGSEGFTGKTGRLLTGRLGCRARNLGPTQLSIDSAVVVCRLVALGLGLGRIRLSTELEIEHGDGHSTVLPYGYPVLDGKVIFTPGLREYLRKR
ncbi:MAG: hypothetical protein FJ149_00130 [Euryarchaeota archaeon]|nr:hypothetical protein [Euryarchaeota archaeon]